MKQSARESVRPAQGLKRSEQQDLAKAGMIASLGTLVVTGFFKFKGAGMLHAWSGLILVGCSLWHHFLSQAKKTQPPEKAQRPGARTTGRRRLRKTGR